MGFVSNGLLFLLVHASTAFLVKVLGLFTQDPSAAWKVFNVVLAILAFGLCSLYYLATRETNHFTLFLLVPFLEGHSLSCPHFYALPIPSCVTYYVGDVDYVEMGFVRGWEAVYQEWMSCTDNFNDQFVMLQGVHVNVFKISEGNNSHVLTDFD